MTILQTAKELLKKGIALDDPDLIAMANQLIEANIKSEPEPAKPEKKKVSKPVTVVKSNIVDQFRLVDKQQEAINKRMPVTDRARFNAWSDDGIESKEIVTPEVAITKRTREPVKKVKQQCQLCQKTEMVNPVHVRDFFICDGCLLNKNKGRQ
jgi:hypothetical protein